MSQRDTILRLLEQRGDKGVHSFELYEMHMPRGAAVICQLRKDGYPIESEREPYHGEAKGVRYVLRSDELVAVGVAAPASREVARTGPYDPYSEWA